MKNLTCILILFLSLVSCKEEKLSDVEIEAVKLGDVLKIISSKSWRISSYSNVGYYTSNIVVNGIADFYSDQGVIMSNTQNSLTVNDRFIINADSIFFEKFGSEKGSYMPNNYSFGWKIIKLTNLDFWISRVVNNDNYLIKFRAQ